MTSAFLTFALLVLAPTMAHAAAFPSITPRPTHSVASIDSWSPAPTAAPQLPFNVFKRGQKQGSNTCGFNVGVSRSIGSAITCPQPSALCATNNHFGVHGCCSSIKGCMIPTTCIPYTALSTTSPTSPSSPTLSSNEELSITRCTEAGKGECYEYTILFDRTSMIQHGCAASAFTSTAFASLGMSLGSGTETVTVTREPVITPTSSSSPAARDDGEGNGGKPSLGAIVGGTIGACLFVSFIAFVCFLAWRRRRAHNQRPKGQGMFQQPGTVEYNPLGFPSPGYPSPALSSPGFGSPYVDEGKGWQQHGRDAGGVPQYPGMGRVDIQEVEGRQRAVEAPCTEKLVLAEAPDSGK